MLRRTFFSLAFVLLAALTASAQTPPAPALERTLNWQTHPLPTPSPSCLWPHPDDETLWIVCSATGFYVSNDAGQTYRKYGTRDCSQPASDPQAPNRIAVVCSLEGVYFSEDRGANWTLRRLNTSEWLYSIRFSPRDGTIWVGPRNTVTQHGVFRSVDHGLTFQFFSFGNGYRNLIEWAIFDDPDTGTVYVGTEIGDHPQPYKPPQFRSLDRGQTWEEMPGLGFHVVSFGYSSVTKEVFAMQEGPGLYKSSDQGRTWRFLSNAPTASVLIDAKSSRLMWGGRHGQVATGTLPRDGVAYSPDLGATWFQAGLTETTAFLAQGKSGARLYAATFPYALRSAAITAPALNFSVLNGADGELATFLCNPLKEFTTAKITVDATEIPLTQTVVPTPFPFSTATCSFRVPLGMSPGDHPARLTLDSTVLPFTLRVAKGTGAVLTGMTTVLFTQPARFVPGDIVSLFGYRLSKSTSTLTAESIAAVPFPAQLNQTKVTVFNAQNVQFPAAVQLAFTDAAGNSQINVHMPTNLIDGTYRIRVDRMTAAGAIESSTDFITFTVGNYQPLFLGNATYPVFLQNITQDPLGRVFVTEATPAHPGDLITLYATGMGVTNPPLAAGTVPTSLTRIAVFPQNTLVTAAGVAPVSNFGHVASPQFPGLYQLSITLPATIDLSRGVVLRHELGAVRVDIPIPVAAR